ncbi:MAG: glycosyltransferase, partial [Candidatus Pacebacteria bacterium]|nr:glycosyltransferase [Candidatus Paceibacterota bacterium]
MRSTENTVSVIIPAYNAEAFLDEAVLSAVPLPAVLEVLVVEDGSTDGTPGVCSRLEADHAKVRVLRHADGFNHGQSASRNRGIREARGRYIALLDADDTYLSNRFADDLPLLASDESLDGVYSAVRLALEEDYTEAPWGNPELTTVRGRVEPEKLFQKLVCGGKGEFCTDGITVRRDIFSIVGFFDESLHFSADTAMWLKMAAVCRLAGGCTDRPVAIRRRHARNMSRRDNPVYWRTAGDHIWSVMCWGRQVGLSPWHVRLLRRTLALAVLGRRPEGLGRGLLSVVRNVSRYVVRDPLLVRDV